MVAVVLLSQPNPQLPIASFHSHTLHPILTNLNINNNNYLLAMDDSWPTDIGLKHHVTLLYSYLHINSITFSFLLTATELKKPHEFMILYHLDAFFNTNNPHCNSTSEYNRGKNEHNE